MLLCVSLSPKNRCRDVIQLKTGLLGSGKQVRKDLATKKLMMSAMVPELIKSGAGGSEHSKRLFTVVETFFKKAQDDSNGAILSLMTSLDEE